MLLFFHNKSTEVELTYSSPPSKSEHRLSLSGLRGFVGNEGANAIIQPNSIGVFYYANNKIHLIIENKDSAYNALIDQFSSAQSPNNAIINFAVNQNPQQQLFKDLKITSLPKSFLLLAGISGTGKTRFVREQAKANGNNYQLVAVRPDWQEPSDLLGYVSRLSGKGPEYITTDVLCFLAKAWAAIADAKIDIKVEQKGERKALEVATTSEALSSLHPYWLCLDEMNLAPVEQYFADYLSILETREWNWENGNPTYRCDALLSANIFSDPELGEKLRSSLKLDEDKYDGLWKSFTEAGMPIPFNLIVAGTVNMDETTHGFSRKVIDRALSFDFGEFFPNDFDAFFDSQPLVKTLSFPTVSDARNERERLSQIEADPDGKLTIGFLKAINEKLKQTPFELAYRALNELLLSVLSINPKTPEELKAVWDDFLMCKVLPRIDGDADKLSTANGNNLLEELESVLAKELFPIWDAESEDKQRPDLYREKNAADNADEETKIIKIPCRSKAKLAWMKNRLEKATFTSFWP